MLDEIYSYSHAQERRYLLVLAFVVLVMGSCLPLLMQSADGGSPDLHVAVSIFGSLLGLTAGLALVASHSSLGNRLHLLFGLAFFLGSVMGLVGGVLTLGHSRGWVDWPQRRLDRYLIATYVSGRLLMSLILLLAPILMERLGKARSSRSATVWMSVAILVLALAATGLLLKLASPEFVRPNDFCARPVDFLLGLLFAAAFVNLMMLHHRSGCRDQMIWWVALSAGVAAVAQFVMSASKETYDTAFNLAHSYTAVAYVVPVIGFPLAQIAKDYERREAVRKLLETERLAAVGRTVAGLTHCIKNVLQGIMGGAFILDKGLRKGELDRIRSGWSIISRNQKFMETLVQDLLMYAKKREPEYAPTDLNALCDDIAQLASTRGESHGVTVEFQPDEALESVELDPDGVRRCLLNLAMNAVDACVQTKGTVTIATQCPRGDGVVRITVADTGCGMSEEVLARLFTEFFSTKGSKGTGLGLPLVRKIINEHRGRIEVRSLPGEGTTFSIELPTARPQD